MKKKFKLIDLDCANCAAKMEDAIKKIEGVEDATVSFMKDSKIRMMCRGWSRPWCFPMILVRIIRQTCLLYTLTLPTNREV